MALLRRSGRPVEIITVGGSVEVAPLLGLSHWIVDLVDTGNTLRANGLTERETILECTAVLVANRASQKLKLDEHLRLMDRIERRGTAAAGEAANRPARAPRPVAPSTAEPSRLSARFAFRRVAGTTGVKADITIQQSLLPVALRRLTSFSAQPESGRSPFIPRSSGPIPVGTPINSSQSR
jgi:ATP phosphoribosyltransferase